MKSSKLIPILCFLFLLAACACSSARVRFCTGNLSVGYFQEYWGTGKPSAGDSASPEYCDLLKKVGVSAVCDYLAWSRIEPEAGKWDWSFYDHNEATLHQNGLQYDIYCWLHFPPKWFMETPDYVPYRCLEHDQPVMQTSIWAPGTLKAYDRFYKELAAHFKDKIDFIRLAMPAEYGEVGFPCGMTKWLVPQVHVHPGYWCNDSFARADFKDAMSKQYRKVETLNKAWGSTFKSFDDLEFPIEAKHRRLMKDPIDMTPAERRRMLDFVDWYSGSQVNFARKAIDTVRKYFPRKEIILSMGYGSQRAIFGNDDYNIVRLCRDEGVSCQTPGNIPMFCMKDLASPCRYYGVRYYTEPPSEVKPDAEVNRIWTDASCGTQTFFDYQGNLEGAAEVFKKYGDLLDGEQPITDVAVFYPTTEHHLKDEDWPGNTIAGTESLRDILDYDLADERMIRDGALNRYKILVAYQGNVMEASTLAALKRWIEGGGILLVRDFGEITTIEGDQTFYNKFFPKSLQTTEILPADRLIASSSQKIGKGRIIVWPSNENDAEKFAALVGDLAHNLSKYFPEKQNVPLVDGSMDTVTATLFRNKILYLNSSDKAIEKTIHLRESDFPRGGRTGRPAQFDFKMMLEPHSIRKVEMLPR